MDTLVLFLILVIVVVCYHNHSAMYEPFFMSYGDPKCGNKIGSGCKFPTYKRPCPSLLDAVPPPDPHHDYRCPGFSHQSTGVSDFDRWNHVWNPDMTMKF